MFGFLSVFTANQFTETFMSVLEPSTAIFEMRDMNWELTIEILLAVITSFVICGGLKNIAKVASVIVLFMVAAYLIAVIVFMALNSSQILPSLKLIFTEDWNFKTIVTGGFCGLVIIGV